MNDLMKFDGKFYQLIPSMIERDGWIEWDGSDSGACKVMEPKRPSDEYLSLSGAVWKRVGRDGAPWMEFYEMFRYRRRVQEESPVERYIREKCIAESFQPLVLETWATALKEGK